MEQFQGYVDVEQCPGFCDGPCRWTTTSNDYGGPHTTELMKTVFHPYRLRLDGWQSRLDKCSGQQIALVQHELKSIVYTLSAGLLKHICTTFYNIYLRGALQRAGQVSHMVYFRQLNTPSMVQEIEALQAKINATEDEDEQRALEEDVTGKILWICWCGICADVDQLLPKVVDCIRREESISDAINTRTGDFKDSGVYAVLLLFVV
ncbi:hypothetical protein M404DRAFT_486766 [Pisolithus tinctorius Marx 270]|uniref:Uncharacterized protein n=1 Tax=Pisolithus tinctorius Marx 270 TaxID=870435 RepID=A0A0C3NDI3_PISTI|nr:hypothetical protein M404DRAFT_486766 [Pisolithus tinctorius Marx 270]